MSSKINGVLVFERVEIPDDLLVYFNQQTPESKRPLVVDCFSGSATTGQVATHMGCAFIGCEANADYVAMGIKRLETPWRPVGERKSVKKPRHKRHHKERLFRFE